MPSIVFRQVKVQGFREVQATIKETLTMTTVLVFGRVYNIGDLDICKLYFDTFANGGSKKKLYHTIKDHGTVTSDKVVDYHIMSEHPCLYIENVCMQFSDREMSADQKVTLAMVNGIVMFGDSFDKGDTARYLVKLGKILKTVPCSTHLVERCRKRSNALCDELETIVDKYRDRIMLRIYDVHGERTLGVKCIDDEYRRLCSELEENMLNDEWVPSNMAREILNRPCEIDGHQHEGMCDVYIPTKYEFKGEPPRQRMWKMAFGGKAFRLRRCASAKSVQTYNIMCLNLSGVREKYRERMNDRVRDMFRECVNIKSGSVDRKLHMHRMCEDWEAIYDEVMDDPAFTSDEETSDEEDCRKRTSTVSDSYKRDVSYC